MNKKAALQISFAWLFAIIVGAFILFLAIYAVTKIIGTEQEISNVEVAKQMSVLMNPLETGFETGKTTSLILPAETKIYNRCDNSGNFGAQLIKAAQKNFGKWTDANIDIEFPNKYIFSEENAEGKEFYLFSKPFEFPFKVSDLIYLIPASEEYCFVEPEHPSEFVEKIKSEVSELGQKNLLLECSEKSIKICFGEETDCDIIVNENGRYVEKNGTRIYFEGNALMYAGIFSDKEIYECQVKRLMQRVENLALLYEEKSNFISQICDSGLTSDLSQLKSSAGSLGNSKELYLINNAVENIKEKNEAGVCGLW